MALRHQNNTERSLLTSADAHSNVVFTERCDCAVNTASLRTLNAAPKCLFCWVWLIQLIWLLMMANQTSSRFLTAATTSCVIWPAGRSVNCIILNLQTDWMKRTADNTHLWTPFRAEPRPCFYFYFVNNHFMVEWLHGCFKILQKGRAVIWCLNSWFLVAQTENE